MKATELLSKSSHRESIETTLDRYVHRFDNEHETTHQREAAAATLSQEYYGLATDFYLHGWGKMFHFGVRRKGQSLQDSLLWHEKFLADKLQLKAGEKCLDIGCGVGGPMMNMAKKTGATISGINNSAYQIAKGKEFLRNEGLETWCSFTECNWLHLPFADNSHHKAYAIEATCHAADKLPELFAEIHRVLKPGALFGGYDWVLTDKFKSGNPEHEEIKHKIEIGSGVPNLYDAAFVADALRQAGFEILECRDMAPDCSPETPWYLPLKGDGLSLTSFRTSPVGIRVMRYLVRALEFLRIVPKGSSKVHHVLEMAADGLARGGERGIFTPMLFFLARKK